MNSWPVMTKEQVATELVAPIAKTHGEDFVSATVKVDIRQLPHGEGLALPAYQSADAAGLDLLAAVPADAPLILPPGKVRDGADRPDDRAAVRAMKPRCGRAPGLPPSTASPC